MQIVKNLRLSSVPKNLLIFLPIIISGNLNNLNFEKAFVSLIFFSLITSICYLINDFTDKKTDKFNQTIPQVERFGDSKICEIFNTYYPQLQNPRLAE